MNTQRGEENDALSADCVEIDEGTTCGGRRLRGENNGTM